MSPEPFATKFNIVMHHHEPECCVTGFFFLLLSSRSRSQSGLKIKVLGNNIYYTDTTVYSKCIMLGTVQDYTALSCVFTCFGPKHFTAQKEEV